jgi:hypothetical protein
MQLFSVSCVTTIIPYLRTMRKQRNYRIILQVRVLRYTLNL